MPIIENAYTANVVSLQRRICMYYFIIVFLWRIFFFAVLRWTEGLILRKRGPSSEDNKSHDGYHIRNGSTLIPLDVWLLCPRKGFMHVRQNVPLPLSAGPICCDKRIVAGSLHLTWIHSNSEAISNRKRVSYYGQPNTEQTGRTVLHLVRTKQILHIYKSYKQRIMIANSRTKQPHYYDQKSTLLREIHGVKPLIGRDWKSAARELSPALVHSIGTLSSIITTANCTTQLWLCVTKNRTKNPLWAKIFALSVNFVGNLHRNGAYPSKLTWLGFFVYSNLCHRKFTLCLWKQFFDVYDSHMAQDSNMCIPPIFSTYCPNMLNAHSLFFTVGLFSLECGMDSRTVKTKFLLQLIFSLELLLIVINCNVILFLLPTLVT